MLCLQQYNKNNSASKSLSEKVISVYENVENSGWLQWSIGSETRRKCFNIIYNSHIPLHVSICMEPKTNGLLATYMVNENVVAHSYDH
jgi:hypothetical protein